MLTQARTKQWQLGEWVLDAPSHRLIHLDNQVSITAKMLDVLLVLVVNAGRPVAKEVIYQTVWPDVIVSEQLIARAISDLRKVFGDDPKKPKFIETLPKAGYRWLPDASEIVAVTDNTQPPKTADDLVKPQSPTRIKNQLLVLLGVMAALIVFAFIWLGDDNTAETGGQVASGFDISAAQPLTSDPGVENAPTLSPDGKTLAYVFRKSGATVTQILLSDMISRQIIGKVPNGDGQSVNQFGPRFSPDGQRLAFTEYSDNHQQCDIYYVSVKKLQDRQRVATCSARFMMSVDWSADGKQLFFTQDLSAQKRALMRVDISSNTIEQLSIPAQPGTTDYSPRVSPDGKNVIFVRGQLKPSHHSALYLLALDDPQAKPRALTPMQVQRNIFGLSWLSNEQLVYLLDADIDQSLRQMSIVDGSELLLDRGSYHRIDYHRPSSLLLYAQSHQVSNIVRLSVDGKNTGETMQPQTLLASTRNDHQPRVSPDGRQMAFIADRSGSDQLWLANINGSNLRQLTRLSSGTIADASWSPDGQQMLLTVQSKEVSALYRLALGDLTLSRIDTGDFDVSDARWSSHEKWLIASCNLEGRWQICRIPSDGGKPLIVTQSGGVSPYAPHHSDFVYFTRQQQGLWRMPLLGGSAELVWADFPEHSWKNWILYENQLYYLDLDSHNERVKLTKRDLISNQSEVIYQGLIQWDETSFDISPDGSQLYLSALAPASDDIYAKTLRLAQ